MGYLLSSAIKMQGGSAASPTLTVNWTELSPGGSVNVYKDTIYVGTPTPGVPFNVSLVAGISTFYVEVISPFMGTASYTYYVNGVFVTSGFSFGGTVTSATYGATGTNAYVFNCITDTAA